MDKSKIYIDLSKCTEEERKSLTPILKKAGEHICYPIEKSDNNLLSFSPHCNGWNPFREVYSKQELTYPEFIKLFEGGDGKEVLQVDIYSGELNTERILTYKKLSEQYNIEESTVRDIFNAGADWVINLKSNN